MSFGSQTSNGSKTDSFCSARVAIHCLGALFSALRSVLARKIQRKIKGI